MSVKFDFSSLGRRLTADWPVTVHVPQDGGATEEQSFMVRFQLLTKDEVAQIEAGSDMGHNLVRKAMVGFGSAEAQSFSPEILEQLVETPYVRIALNRAYGQFSAGIAAKN